MSRRSSTGSRRRRASGPEPGARVLHLDCFSGIAGNMLLAALLDLGLPREQLEADLAGLRLPHRLIVRRVQRGAIAARYVDVEVSGGRPRRPARRAPRAHAHPHDRDHDHDHAHEADHEHGGDGHGRHYHEIVRVLEDARLDADVRARALATFEALARAEARVHGIPVERVHFHEVGAVDAIVDVTGAAIGLSRLGVARVTASPVALGGGRALTAHGTLPLPAPATLELLRGIPTVPAHVEWETVTPTGAALLRTWVEEFRALPAMTIEAIGHGAGNDRPGPMPNVLRAVLGRESGAGADRVVCLETNLDDLVPEHFDHLMERLFEEGALDVSIAHVQMKKNRPGFLVRVIARPAERLRLARTLFAESSAIGVRVSEADRVVLAREAREVDTPWGRVGVKIVWDVEGAAHASAEYDDCKRAARKHGVPLRDVVRVAEEAARAGLRAARKPS
jgi:pyridinium-3,5-bisthiocarboxylic acid mononucleotide nickel chelatase